MLNKLSKISALLVLAVVAILLLVFMTQVVFAQTDEETELFTGPNCVGALTSYYAGEKGGTGDISIGIGELQKTRIGYIKLGDIKGETGDTSTQSKKKPKEIVVVGSKVAEQIIACVDSR